MECVGEVDDDDDDDDDDCLVMMSVGVSTVKGSAKV